MRRGTAPTATLPTSILLLDVTLTAAFGTIRTCLRILSNPSAWDILKWRVLESPFSTSEKRDGGKRLNTNNLEIYTITLPTCHSIIAITRFEIEIVLAHPREMGRDTAGGRASVRNRRPCK